MPLSRASEVSNAPYLTAAFSRSNHSPPEKSRCFWGAERKFWQSPGVFSTQVGYAGGLTPNPSYSEVCSGLTGHTEVVRVVVDPKLTRYAELLRVFWESHDPTQGMRQGNDIGTQYRSAIFYYDAEQREQAEESRRIYQQALSAGGTAQSRPRSKLHLSSIVPKLITSSTWPKIPTATAASAVQV